MNKIGYPNFKILQKGLEICNREKGQSRYLSEDISTDIRLNSDSIDPKHSMSNAGITNQSMPSVGRSCRRPAFDNLLKRCNPSCFYILHSNGKIFRNLYF